MIDTGEGARILTQRSPFYYFRIAQEFPGPSSAGFSVEYSPGDQQITAGFGPARWYEVVPAHVRHWLRFLDRELTTIDPWAQIRADRELRAGQDSELENTPFTPDEQAAINGQLRELTEYIRTAGGLTPAQMQPIELQVTYLDDAATRLGRVDWRTAFAGVMFTLFAEAAAPPEVLRQGMALVLRGLSHLFGVDLPELPPG